LGARPDGIRAACSHCEYARQFSPDLGGRFYRCPRCRQGVIAVPRASAEEAQRWRTSEDEWLGWSGKRPQPPAQGQLSQTDVDPNAPVHTGKKPSGKAEARPEARPDARPEAKGEAKFDAAPRGKTTTGARKVAIEPSMSDLIDDSSTSGSAASGVDSARASTTSSPAADALSSASASGAGASDPSGSNASGDPSETPRFGGGPARPLPSSGSDEAAGPNNKGEVGTVRKILVECGLCGFHVGIPPAFFGKTVHCPSCAGDTVFSESTLEPVKDELFDRLALETHERAVLFRPPGEARWATLRSFLVGVGLGLVAIVALWGVSRFRTSSARRAAEEAAVADGWRYASNGEEALLHEPWCRDLTRPGARLTEEEAFRSGRAMHTCD
jgi:hypothetical protein